MCNYTIPLGTAVTYTWPNLSYYPSISYPKCPNCGYCSCCGKADHPGQIYLREDRALAQRRGLDGGDVHPEAACGE
jgi:hypothetical protein